jgi:lipopolysaccharide/colanic/teichoic acid biosynthesis glycosyltransferase
MVFFRHRLVMAALTLGAFLVATWLHTSLQGPYAPFEYPQAIWTLLYVGLLISIGYVLDLPDPDQPAFALLKGTATAIVAAGVIAIVQALSTQQFLPRFVLVSVVVLYPVISWIMSVGIKTGARFQDKQELLLLVDDVEERRISAEILKRGDSGKWRIISGDQAESAARAALLGDPHHAMSGPVVIVLGEEAESAARITLLASRYRNANVRVRTVSALYEELFEKSFVEGSDHRHLLFDVAEVHHATYQRISRLFDFAFGLLIGVALLLITPFVWLGNLIGNRGPLFFVQERVGKEGRVVKIYKFRSMEYGSNSTQWTAIDDPRITRFGRFLRRTHIDELPQAINILKGDIAVVGPRPEQISYVTLLSEKFPVYPLRHAIRPGLTGWAQVNYPYGSSIDDAREKLEYDLYYLRNQGIWLDLVILVRTIRSLIHLKGR